METKETEVPEATRFPDVQSRWDWVEPSVWTTRMQEALENGINGVKETKWFTLMDKVYAEGNLMSAYMKVASNKGAAGVDNLTVARFGAKLSKNLDEMQKQLKEGEYRPNKIRRTYMEKAGGHEKRPLGIPTVRDRIVQTAIRHVIEPIFEKEFAVNSHGFRPERGCKGALREVNQLLETGHWFVVDADLRKCFDRIPHEPLMDRVRERIADTRVLGLIEVYLKQDVLEAGQSWTPEEGTPQGATLSPLLCNIYLNPLDHLMIQNGFQMIRYADDLVILCKSEDQAKRGLELLQEWVEANGLQLHEGKTRLVDMNIPLSHFDFLGYRFKHTRSGRLNRFASPKSEKKLREKLKRITRRSNGHSLNSIILRCNKVTRGWFEYFKQASKWGSSQNIVEFQKLRSE